MISCEVIASGAPDRNSTIEERIGPAPENALLVYKKPGKAFPAGGLLGGGRLEFRHYPDFDEAELFVDGFQPTTVRWEEGRCTAPLELEPAAIIEGVVIAPEGLPSTAELAIDTGRTCGSTGATVAPDGSFRLYGAPGRCRLTVILIIQGASAALAVVEREAQVGGPTFVEIEVPELSDQVVETFGALLDP